MLGRDFNEKLAVFIASWFYTGFIPSITKKSMAGTWGSLFAIPFCLAAMAVCCQPTLTDGSCDLYGAIVKYASILIYIYFLGRTTIGLAEKVIGPRVDWKGKTKTHDQNNIVVDEIWGMFITYYPIFLGLISVETISWKMAVLLIIGFGYFRLFDIIKIWPVKFFDKLESPFGVMMDDGISGLQAGSLLYITNLLLIYIATLLGLS